MQREKGDAENRTGAEQSRPTTTFCRMITTDSKMKHWALVIVTAVVVIAVSIGWFCLAPDRNEAQRMGDWLSVLGTIFSGLAFVALVATVAFQSRELELQREELQKVTDANRDAARALQEQIKMQLQDAELRAVSSLLNSVNSQLDRRPGILADVNKLETAAQKYHQRLHEALERMGRGFSE